MSISTHILTKRMTNHFDFFTPYTFNFNSHPHEEDDIFMAPRICINAIFQLTSSRRGWRPTKWIPGYCGDFNSHPHEEDDNCRTSSCHVIDCISTHILTKRMTAIKKNRAPNIIFQLTSSRRGWRILPFLRKTGEGISTHILTKRMTNSIARTLEKQIFQLTSSRRGWRLTRWSIVQESYFNSHPHEEDDDDTISKMRGETISTHILTKRMTSRACSIWHDKSISTHILTKRMTD